MKYSFIAAERNKEESQYAVTFMCRMLNVRRQGFYEWLEKETTQNQRRDATLTETIKAIMDGHCHRVGTRRVRSLLARLGEQVSHKRVHRLMQAAGLQCRHPRRRGSLRRSADQAELADLLQRDFTATQPDEKWVGDITYLPTNEGWAYLATVLDCYSRRIVGWRLDTHLRAELVTDALADSIARRNPAETIFHADRGSQYTSRLFRNFCRDHNIHPSVGDTGICFDNSVAESFFATLKKELIHGHTWSTFTDLRIAVFQFIEGYYNRHRPHSTINYRTPQEHEDEFAKRTLTAA